MYSVYILMMSNGKYYVGQTNNLKSRLHRHRTGQCRSTKGHLPVELLYSEKHDTRSDAMKRETYLKSLKSHEALSQIITLNE